MPKMVDAGVNDPRSVFEEAVCVDGKSMGALGSIAGYNIGC